MPNSQHKLRPVAAIKIHADYAGTADYTRISEWAQLDLQSIQHRDYFGHLSIFTALCITPTCLKTLFRLRSETLHLGTLYWKLFFLQFHYSIEQDRKYIVSNEWYVRDLNNKSQTFYQWSTEGLNICSKPKVFTICPSALATKVLG